MATPLPQETVSETQHVGNDMLSLLPLELKHQILDSLSARDVINLRLVSSVWAVLGEELFFKDGFTVRPHLNDMARLEMASKHPGIAKSITSLTFYMGDMSFEQFADAVKRKSWKGDLKKVWEIIDRMYSAPMFNRHCNERILSEVLPRLPNLTSLTATSIKYPFMGCGVDLLRAWKSMMDYSQDFEEYDEVSFHDTSLSTRRYTSVLSAAQHLKSPITKLVLDPLPADFFVTYDEMSVDEDDGQHEIDKFLDPSKQTIFEKLVSHVQDLQMGMMGFSFRYNDSALAAALGDVFGTMKQLRYLDLTWDLADAQVLRFAKVWQSRFLRATWPHLERLRLRKTEFDDVAILPFLRKHSSTLKYLELTEDAVQVDIEQTRTFRDLLTGFREHLKLEKFQFLVTEGDQPIYDRNWDRVDSIENLTWREMAEMHYRHNRVKDAQLLEWFVLGKISWPMKNDHPDFDAVYHPWKRLSAEQIRQGMEDSLIDIDSLIEDEWESDVSEEYVDEDEDEVEVEFEDEDENGDEEDDDDEGYSDLDAEEQDTQFGQLGHFGQLSHLLTLGYL